MDANELIERYVHEVGNYLPRDQREDIEMELRSLLHDSLEEQAAEAGKKPSTRAAVQLLNELGEPEEMASQYRRDQYLIGPELFPVYKLVLTIAATIISVLHVAGFVYVLLSGDTAVLGQSIWEWFTNYFRSVMLSAGIITLIFAGLERAQVVELGLKVKRDAEWDPLSLPPVEDPYSINRFEIIFGLIWTIAFVILFNFYPEWLGLVPASEGETAVLPLLAPAFAVYVPLLTLAWMLEVMLKSVVLVQGGWTRVTRWLELSLVPLTIYILNSIRTGGEIFTIPAATTGMKFGLIFIIIIVVLDGLVKLVRLLSGRPFPVREIFRSRSV